MMSASSVSASKTSVHTGSITISRNAICPRAAEPVEVHFLWRPQLGDPDDEIVLEAAVNGRSHVIVTHNVRHFQPATGEFGIQVMTPGSFRKRIKT
jgi:predicted nucleic acid-binding protein